MNEQLDHTLGRVLSKHLYRSDIFWQKIRFWFFFCFLLWLPSRIAPQRTDGLSI